MFRSLKLYGMNVPGQEQTWILRSGDAMAGQTAGSVGRRLNFLLIVFLFCMRFDGGIFYFHFFLFLTLILISRGSLDFGLNQRCIVCIMYYVHTRSMCTVYIERA